MLRRLEAKEGKMDKTLSRNEAKELMQLLGLDMTCWGNLPLMRTKYLSKCKEFHPDKGGNEEKMKKLNSLYLKLQECVSTVHQLNEEEDEVWSSSQVECTELCCNFPPKKYRLVGEVYGDVFEEYILKDWDICLKGFYYLCNCFYCFLDKRHKQKYKIFRKPPMWIECYCYRCYREWFGFEISAETFFYWKKIIFLTTMQGVGLTR